ncbi:MAG: helicase HerA-like domain-containing protein [Casimicrobium sp.]
MAQPYLVAKTTDTNTDVLLLPKLANRHGLITGATGTGKTVSLQVLAEGFSRMGVPTFMADVKGDLTGLSQMGGGNQRVTDRVAMLKLTNFSNEQFPVTCWDVFGEQGHPLRATIAEMGPLLLSRILNLNDTQSGVLTAAFKIADDKGLLLLDLKDLRAMLVHAGENAREYQLAYGNISGASIGAIQRGILTLESQGGEKFFGEPALNLEDLMQTVDGKGVINILAADKLLNNPRIYATFLLWLLSELFESLPEVGDPEQPKLVFFFDEAHLLFNEAPPELRSRIEQVVRLVRSKGVGVYFVTQNPLDIPDIVLGQLGNRIQHALRAYTPRDAEAVRTAASTFRPNPKINTEQAITELGTGEALISFLDEKGRPNPVERCWVIPPSSRIGPVTPAERAVLIKTSLVAGIYDTTADRESAYEKLTGRVEARMETADKAATATVPAATPETKGEPGFFSKIGGMIGDVMESKNTPHSRQTVGEAAMKSAARAVGSEVGRRVIRGLLGSIFGGKR